MPPKKANASTTSPTSPASPASPPKATKAKGKSSTTSKPKNQVKESPRSDPWDQWQGRVHQMDCIEGMKRLPDASVDLILCDPPYNIGKDFGNDSDRQAEGSYLNWCLEWINECHRVMKPTGMCYIFGFSETLSLIHARMHADDQLKWRTRWLIWHYTNKNKPTLNFWQRTHESILCCYNPSLVNFNRDAVREPYCEEFLKNYPGKTRKATPGRINYRNIETIYKAHPNGALPRDVIKVPALSGAYGKRERVDHPSQKPVEICEKLVLSALPKQAPEAPEASEASEGRPLKVLVPFAGSGSECLAAKKCRASFVGFEINQEYITLCHERLRRLDEEADKVADKEASSAESSAQATGTAEPGPLVAAAASVKKSGN